MIHLKSSVEQAIMKEGGMKLRTILSTLLADIAPGVRPSDIDKKAEYLIIKAGGEPSFQKVPGYKWATCINVDDVVVHGIPTNYRFRLGDVVGVDVGLCYKGYHTDTSWTVIVGGAEAAREPDVVSFLSAGEKALIQGIEQARAGNHIGDISQAMQQVIEGAGYSVVRELVGHGIGKMLHEEPEVPGMRTKSIAKTPLIEAGLAIAIEIMYTIGDPHIYVDRDNWTIRTKNGKIAGLFEKTVIIKNHGVDVLT